ncbi:DUF1801 domain-containing protein [Rhodococcus sp. TAF43]|uniref:DUF1801 domain-containing protein n=1 Tax=Rhodococcus sp. TAF43 TaxID=3237483 RepID=UPI003F944012
MAATNKTQATDASVAEFLDKVADPTRRADALELRSLMESATGAPATMWGTSIVGFGTRSYRYASGRSGRTPLIGFSPRASALTLYLTLDFDAEAAALAGLGPHKLGKGCLYVTRLDRVDKATLVDLIARSVTAGRELDEN